MQILDEQEIRSLITFTDALDSVERAYTCLVEKKYFGPPNTMIKFPDKSKEFHIKGAGIENCDVFTIKMASGFFNNKKLYDLPNGNGMVMLFSSETGFPLAFLQDGGYLTDLRTSAAAATMAGKMMVRKDLPGIVLGIIGNGLMAKMCFQMYMELVKQEKASKINNILIWARRKEAAKALGTEFFQQHPELNGKIGIIDSANEVAARSDIIFTCTASREPLITNPLQPGCVCVAVGSDQPGKRELGEATVMDAMIICDDVQHAREAGETEYLSDDVFDRNVAGYCGDVFLGKLNRISDTQKIIVDLTGVGTQDASICYKLWLKIKKN